MFLKNLTSIKYSILNFMHLVLALLLLTAKEMLVNDVVGLNLQTYFSQGQCYVNDILNLFELFYCHI